MHLNELGRTGLNVSQVCVGASPLGGMPAAYGYDVPEDTGLAAVEAIFASQFNFLDTSNEYSDGRSEQRIGDVIRRVGLPDSFVLATKIDPKRGSFVMDADRVYESFAESISRLGVSEIPLLYLHDPERFSYDDLVSNGGAIDAMRRLKSNGVVGHLGIAGWDLDLLRRFVDTGAFDVVLNHNRFTLMDQAADPLIAHAVTAGVAFVNAAPFAGGILAKGPKEQSRYTYQEADAATIRRVEELESICSSHGVDLAAAALQFSTRDPRIASTVVGISKPHRVNQILAHLQTPTSELLWRDLAEAMDRHRADRS